MSQPTYELSEELGLAGFSDAQVTAIMEMGLVDPTGLGEGDLSDWWETYRSLYPAM
jgi:hypothetical protein